MPAGHDVEHFEAAEIADLQAKDAIERGALDEQRFRQSIRATIGAQRAGFAGANIDVGYGSAVDVQADAAFLGELDALTLRNNAGLVAHAAAGFGASTILTTVAEKSFSGPMFTEVTGPFPGQALLDRTSMNTWEDEAVIKQVNAIGKKRIVLAGLWTSVCIVGPALSALDQGFEVYVITDACGDVSLEAHNRAQLVVRLQKILCCFHIVSLYNLHNPYQRVRF